MNLKAFFYPFLYLVFFVSFQGSARATALTDALDARDYDRAGILLDEGADMNAVGMHPPYTGARVRIEMSPLQLVMRNYSETFQIPCLGFLYRLIEAGAELRPPVCGTPLLVWAIENSPTTDLPQFAGRDLARLLLDRGAHYDAPDDVGSTPLMVAAERGKLDLVRSIIMFDVDLDATDRSGMTALMYAARVRSEEGPMIVEALLEAGAGVRAVDEYGNNALMHAVQVATGGASVASIRMLLGAGIDVRAVNWTGDSTRVGESARNLAERIYIPALREEIPRVLDAALSSLRSVGDLTSESG